MAEINANEARHAYSGLLLIPGFESLRFSPLLKLAKRLWGGGSKYNDFWDAKIVLKKLVEGQLDWNDVRQVRDRLILLLRLCHLCRSVDLQRCCRRLAAGCWLQLRRKGALRAKFERLLELQQPAVSPLHVAKRYVEFTAGQVPPGGALFVVYFRLTNPCLQMLWEASPKPC